jgi:parallel beta-helix repeat protein
MSAARHKKSRSAARHRELGSLRRLFVEKPKRALLATSILLAAVLEGATTLTSHVGSASASDADIRIRAGAGPFTDGQGVAWSGDRYFVGGLTAGTKHAIASTSNQALYQANRYAMSAYNVPVANGTYSVTVDTAETYWSNTGKRVFSATVEGKPLFTNLDLVAKLGANVAYQVSTQAAVTDGLLQIGFSASVDYPVVSGIEIHRVDGGSAVPTGPTPSASTATASGSAPAPAASGAGSSASAPPAAPTASVTRGVAAVPQAISGTIQACTGGVTVTPGMNLQALVNANPAGTTFSFAPGRYVAVTADVKAGDRFCGAGMGSTVLDGSGVNSPAFYAGSSDDDGVTVSGFTITNYRPSAKLGAIDSDATGDRAQGWRVFDNNVNHNSQIGVAVGSGSRVIGNYLNDNGRYGLTGGGSNSVFSYNEIARNNANRNDTGDAGGTKFAVTVNLIVSHNWVHDNIGPGLWTDIDNSGTVYDSNLVEGNTEAGIFHEISYSCQVTNNIVRRNGTSSSPWVLGAGISISNSQGCEVANNYLEDNANGIIGIASIRGGDPRLGNYQGPWLLVNNSFHDNYVRQTRGVSGVAGSCAPNGSTCLDPSAAGSRNSFGNNHYYVKSPISFSWGPGTKTFPQWQSAGQEKGGSSAGYDSFGGVPALAVGPTAPH